MLLFLMVQIALADPHTETFGGDDEWVEYGSSTVKGMCFSVDTDVTLSGVQAYMKRGSGAAPDFAVVLWIRNSSAADWEYKDHESVDAPGTSATWVGSEDLSWRLSSDDVYCVGIYASDGDGVELRKGEEFEDNEPDFGEFWGVIGCSRAEPDDNPYDSCDASGSRAYYYFQLTYSATDRDRDGYDILDDCDDDDESVNPGAEEDWYNGVDEDCDGNDADRDGDGYDSEAVARGTDCDDEDPDANPGEREDWYNGVDEDCDGNDADRDEDGYDSEEVGGGDCDDEDPDINPGIEDIPYDGEDLDCSGSDYDYDGDGYDSDEYEGEDCDDTNEDVHPDAEEVWYDGLDQDCDGANDYDKDGDGYAVSGDCNDSNPSAWEASDPNCAITPGQGGDCGGCGGDSKEGVAMIGLLGLAWRRRRRSALSEDGAGA